MGITKKAPAGIPAGDIFVDKTARGWYNKSTRDSLRLEERMVIMTKEELLDRALEDFAKLQRIIQAADPRKEAENQKRLVEAKLQAFGIVTEKLEGE